MEIIEQQTEERSWTFGLLHWLGIAFLRGSSRRVTVRITNLDPRSRGLKPAFCAIRRTAVAPSGDAGGVTPSSIKPADER